MEEAVGSSKAPTSNLYWSIVVLLGDGKLLVTSFTSLWQHLELCCVINFYFQLFFKQRFTIVGAVRCCFPGGVH